MAMLRLLSSLFQSPYCKNSSGLRPSGFSSGFFRLLLGRGARLCKGLTEKCPSVAGSEKTPSKVRQFLGVP